MLNCQSDEWSTYPTWQHVSQEFPCWAAKIRRWIQLFHKGKLLSVVWGEWADLSVFRYSFSMWWVLSHHLSVNVYHHCSVDGFDHSYEITRILSMLLHLLCWNEQLLSINLCICHFCCKVMQRTGVIVWELIANILHNRQLLTATLQCFCFNTCTSLPP